MCSVRHQRGFTLAEAIISVAMLGIIGALVFGTFARAMDSRDRAEKITGRYHQVRQAMLRMSREIQMAYVSVHKKCSDPRTETLFYARSAAGGTRLDFTSFSHYKMRADANESDQNEIGYYIGRDPDPEAGADRTATVLIRREQARIDDDGEEGGVEQVLCEGVKELEMEFYDDEEDRWESEWDTRSIEFKRRLPMFVSIKLIALGPDGQEEVFVTKTRIHLQKAIQIVGSPCLD